MLKKAINSTTNLCDHCSWSYATCINEMNRQVEYGNGYGHDNVMACDGYDGEENILKERSDKANEN